MTPKKETPDDGVNVDVETHVDAATPAAPTAPARRRSSPTDDGAGVAIAGLHDRTAALERDVAEIKGRPPPASAAPAAAPAPWYDRGIDELLGLDDGDDDETGEIEQ
jgi:hypothetical protein